MLYHHRLGSTGTLMYLLWTPGSRVARPDNTKVPSIHVSNGALVRGTVQLLVPILGISARFGCARGNIDIILHPHHSCSSICKDQSFPSPRTRDGSTRWREGASEHLLAIRRATNHSAASPSTSGHPCRSQAFPHPAIGRCMQPKALIGLKRGSVKQNLQPSPRANRGVS